ncbi:MAG: Rieske (2Fe-2S) protein [Sphingobacteriaceae bacterium]
MKWIKLFGKEILDKDDFIRALTVEGRKICLIRNEGIFYATQRKCPHAGGDLSQGWCKNGKLICPIHRYEYELLNGKGSPGQGDYINTYPLEVRKDGIYIGLEEKWLTIRKLFRLLRRSSK